MVPVAKVADAFSARVLSARLGSDGIMTQLRGGGVDGPYPIGDVEVLVSTTDLDIAREILLAEEVESAFEGAGQNTGTDAEEVHRAPLARWIVRSILVGLVLFAYVNTISFRPASPDLEPDPSGVEEPG